MRRLILFRHAKSSWAESDLADHDRPLAERGRQAAPLMAAWLAERGYAPDAVLCSSSVRAIETWAAAQPLLPQAPPPQILRDLYHADPATMLRILQAVPDSAETVLMVGHQPGIGAFARKLADDATPPRAARAFKRFPTAACAVLDLPIERWADAAFGAARFHSFAAPRELV